MRTKEYKNHNEKKTKHRNTEHIVSGHIEKRVFWFYFSGSFGFDSFSRCQRIICSCYSSYKFIPVSIYLFQHHSSSAAFFGARFHRIFIYTQYTYIYSFSYFCIQFLCVSSVWMRLCVSVDGTFNVFRHFFCSSLVAFCTFYLLERCLFSQQQHPFQTNTVNRTRMRKHETKVNAKRNRNDCVH